MAQRSYYAGSYASHPYPFWDSYCRTVLTVSTLFACFLFYICPGTSSPIQRSYLYILWAGICVLSPCSRRSIQWKYRSTCSWMAPFMVSLLAETHKKSISHSFFLCKPLIIRSACIQPILGNCNGIRGLRYTSHAEKTHMEKSKPYSRVYFWWRGSFFSRSIRHLDKPARFGSAQ